MINYYNLSKEGISPRGLAQKFLMEYFKEKIQYPINPFQMLADHEIMLVIRPFKKCEGIYLPAENESDLTLVGINQNRPITRQRYTAAHELCHHIKDKESIITCSLGSKNEIEKFAEKFAAELLMPIDEFKLQVSLNERDGKIDLFGVLRVADFFGVSFQSCLQRVAFETDKYCGPTSMKELKKAAKEFKPDEQRRKLGLFNDNLYEQLINAMEESFKFEPDKHTAEKFKSEFIYFDSRLEGVEVDRETVAEIVTDLRLNKQESIYCISENRNIIEVAGLSLAYDYVFNYSYPVVSVFDIKEINRILYSLFPYPNYGGQFRESNTVVTNGILETVDYSLILINFFELDKVVENLSNSIQEINPVQVVEVISDIHHKLTVVHAFSDGNGRSIRAFTNLLFLKKRLPFIFFTDKSKDGYKEALRYADQHQNFSPLLECFYKSMIDSFARMSDFMQFD